MDAITWLRERLNPEPATSDQVVYNHMESQSDKSLPIIYMPFDASCRWHWGDRGQILGFVAALSAANTSVCHNLRVLDIGPGDGWPSLPVAKFVHKVIGVDPSPRRIETCTENARRLGIDNAKFVLIPADGQLPFPDSSFDGVMAASSIEQSPNPRTLLQEIFRVLRPGGRLHMLYEAWEVYRGRQERDLCIIPLGASSCRVIIYDRFIDDEREEVYGLTVQVSADEFARLAAPAKAEQGNVQYEDISAKLLEQLRPRITDVQMCTLMHPSGKTLIRWMDEIGFSEVHPVHSCGRFAAKLFSAMPEASRPTTPDGVDELLWPAVQVVAGMAAPIETEPIITAVK